MTSSRNVAANFARLIGWVAAIGAISFVILAISLAASFCLARYLSADLSGWAQAVGAVLAIVAGFATTLYQLGRQKSESVALEAASGRAAYLLAHDAFESVTDRLEAALTPRSDSKKYVLRGARTSEMVGAMREFETSRLPSGVLVDFIRLRSHVAAINQRLSEVYDSEDALQGQPYEEKRSQRAQRLASAVAARGEALVLYRNLRTTACERYGAERLPLGPAPLVNSYQPIKSHKGSA
jgi:hypothetical protein